MHRYLKYSILLVLLYAKFVVASTPNIITTIQPVYPEYAWNNCIGGTVTIEFSVSDEGNVENIVVLNANPSGIFEAVAKQAVSEWKFSPKHNPKELWPRLRQKIEFKPPLSTNGGCQKETDPIDLSPSIDCNKKILDYVYTFRLMRNSRKVSNSEAVWKSLQELIAKERNNDSTDCELLNKMIVFSQQPGLWNEN